MTEVISVRFRGGCKNYFFDPKGHTVKMGDQVIVETAQGPEFGTCTQGNHEVADEAIVQPLCAMLRPATDADRRTVDYNRKKESEAFDICEKKIADHGLEMKLVNVSASFDGSKIIFFFTADGRVDFRELVRDLASVFRARIELRQIGVRDEAKMVGGLGICGRPFCCAQFMDEFLPVSIKMAKTQSLSLNPTKISGTCGRLMCCLKYEQDAYEDAVKRMPKNDSFVLTPDGPGNVSDVNLLKETVNVRLDDRPENARCYRNCEVCVLRNGKGSRDGIVIPDKRPERYVEPVEEQLLPPVTLISDFDPDAAESAEGGKRRRRGGRDRRRSDAPRMEKAAAETPAPKAEGDKPKEGGSNRRRRGRRGNGGSGNGGAAAAAPKPQQPAAEGAPSGEKKRPRRRHRRGGGSGGSKPNGGTEA